MSVWLSLITLVLIINQVQRVYSNDKQYEMKPNTVMIAILVRNKEHTLPYFLTCLERLEYPKDRISLWIRSDNNVDDSVAVVKEWLEVWGSHYHSFRAELEEEKSEEEAPAVWSIPRFSRMIALREEALTNARNLWVDYLLMLDCDVFLTNPLTLGLLVSKGLAVVGPLLQSDGLYSNFWAGMTEQLYYKRTDEYLRLVSGQWIGCFPVPMVHSALLLDLRHPLSDSLSYDPARLSQYSGPHDDIIAFAVSANQSGLGMHVCNDEPYGYVMTPLEKDDSLQYDVEQLRNLKLEILAEEGKPMGVSELLAGWVKSPPVRDHPLDEVFVISLPRRPERRTYMIQALQLLQIPFTFIDAVDGRSLTDDELLNLGVTQLPAYEDPYHKRPMKKGEIGCFLSHHSIWKKVVEDGLSKVMVLEDDVKFEPFFNQKLKELMNELQRLAVNWDLVYLGRKRMHKEQEEWVNNSELVLEAGYSYWTVGYLLSGQGASTLLAGQPLSRLIPVDEYIPILSDKHPRSDWKEYFPDRGLRVLSVQPLLVYPLRYSNDEGYVSDTEDSPLIDHHSHNEL